jgi:hypothetical protein
MRAVRLSDGTIRLGIDDNSDFAITVTGQGDLAFRRNNMFYITPADGNSMLRSQSGVRLGVSDNTTLDLPVTAVSSGTYNASSLMYGRTSGATYISAPTSVFQPYGTTRFKVGFTIEYYKELRTWTFLNGSVEVDPNNLQDYYTITINA